MLRAVGNGGSINIQTGSLTNGAQLDATTLQGNAGSVNIFARDTVSFDGWVARRSDQPQAKGAVGKGGGINIQTGSLSVSAPDRMPAVKGMAQQAT